MHAGMQRVVKVQVQVDIAALLVLLAELAHQLEAMLSVCGRCCCCRARINTLSKARYGTLLKQLGGWGWMQDVLQVKLGSGGGEREGVLPLLEEQR